MYQRLVMAVSMGVSAADTEKEGDDETHDLIRNEKEQRSGGDHGGNGTPVAPRPSDLLGSPNEEKRRDGDHDEHHGRFAVPGIGHGRKIHGSQLPIPRRRVTTKRMI